jgi:hypothetical protein
VPVLAMFWKGRAPCQEADLTVMDMNGNCLESLHYVILIYARHSCQRLQLEVLSNCQWYD